jgi:hypothetical protein
MQKIATGGGVGWRQLARVRDMRDAYRGLVGKSETKRQREKLGVEGR